MNRIIRSDDKSVNLAILARLNQTMSTTSGIFPYFDSSRTKDRIEPPQYRQHSSITHWIYNQSDGSPTDYIYRECHQIVFKKRRED
jgi:hypothetical protein